ncbi:hypothetical protein [Catelliglobosispora koreensis]|uniref:hypothetical protein n=1 Tax=Catelliglobosispora koreensis TaxID=129052 RepID=UPI00035D94AA|nr:hypothetical protein [Catelliglobosispora koreensis]
MCNKCWDNAGSPLNWTPDIARALALTKELYAIHSVGGPLHAVLDDWNIDHETIVPYYDCFTDAELDALYHQGEPIAELDPLAPAVVEGLGRNTRQICDELAALLNTMPVPDRYAMLAYHDRIVDEPKCPAGP